MQIIFHIDLDAFFATAEVIKHPSYKGKPLVVSRESRRSIVSTASYEARKFGIHSAMPLYQAKSLCKNLIVTYSDYSYYQDLSNQFFEYLYNYTNKIQKASIDECYIDMTEYVLENKQTVETIATKIQDELFALTGLSCSIGISPNIFLAKMASDIKKPHGITILTKSNIKDLLWPMPIEKMYGIGKKTAPKLIENGFLTIGDVANGKNYSRLKFILGKYALVAHREANGIDQSKLEYNPKHNKSISSAHTFEYDTNNLDELYKSISILTKDAVERAINKGLLTNNVGITIKYSRTFARSKQLNLNDYTDKFERILSNIKQLFDENYTNQPVRLISVSINNLKKKKEILKQISIFDETKEDDEVDSLINKLNKQFDNDIIIRASTMLEDEDGK